jgi:hypothetical protein
VPDWGSERIRPLLDQLSFQAHAGAVSTDGRGRLARRDVREALERFLIAAGMRDDQAAAASVRCLDYFNHRSGLLVPDDAHDSYTFAHLTLQEHCAGRALALDPDAAALILRYRTDDRWREPILLGLGVAQQTNPALLDRVLSDLIDPDEAGQPKPVERRQRDLIFAAEIGQDRDWGYLRTQWTWPHDMSGFWEEILSHSRRVCYTLPGHATPSPSSYSKHSRRLVWASKTQP